MVSITVKTLQQKQFKVEAEPTDTIAELKSKIEESQGHPAANQKLVYSGKILSDDKTVGDCNIKEKDFLVLMVSKPKATPGAGASTPTPVPTPAPTVSAGGDVPPPAPVLAPTEAAQPPSTTTATTTDTPSTAVPAFGNPSSFVTGSALQTSIDNMVEMGFTREEVMRALKASFNNPDRAVEYLMTGIPEHLIQEGAGPSTAAAAPAGAANLPSLAGGTQQQSALQLPATGGGGGGGSAPGVTVVDSTPQNLFQAAAAQASGRGTGAGAGSGGVGASGGGGGAPFDISALRNSPMFGQIQQMVQQNPALLQPLIQQLVASQPGLAQALNDNPELLYDLLAGAPGGAGLEGDDDAMGDDGPVPPGVHVLNVTEEERNAIDRLCNLGFPRQAAIEAYFACGKNEELAANFLFEGGFD